MPVQSVLDRVFVNNAWKNKFCLVTVYAPTRIGSDHNPLVVDTRERQVTTLKQGLRNRWEPVRFDQLPVKPDRPGL